MSEEQKQVQPVTVQAEETSFQARAEMPLADPVQSQIDEDNKLIPNIGDVRETFSEGKIISPDGKHIVPVDLRFVRTRNEKGGVNVACHVPCFVNNAESTYGK